MKQEMMTICEGGVALRFAESISVKTSGGTLQIYPQEGHGEEWAENDRFHIRLMPVAEGFHRRKLEICPKADLTVERIERNLTFAEEIQDFCDYKTFRCASLAAFIRFRDKGCFTGFANPFCQAEQLDPCTVRQFFEPALMLEKDEVFTFDEDFFCVYPLSGQLVQEQIPKTPLGDAQTGWITRYHNPGTGFALDTQEIRHMKDYADAYLEVEIPRFVVEFYMYFCPEKPQPQTQEEKYRYFRWIDNFKALGGNLIVFQPLQRQTLPRLTGEGYWACWEEGSVAQEILAYAQKAGLDCGIYMGSAQDNSAYCNSAMIPYATAAERPNWKKTDRYGTMSEENCIASDDFCDWYTKVQVNTIRKFGLSMWNWDPGPGNGFFCYSHGHGHLPGKGAYKGFRNALKVIEGVKKCAPNVYLQAFHGLKEYGLWAMKHISQHEAYWEQDPNFFAAMYPDLSADRITANGMRQQAWWNNNFRFLPAGINHSLSHRMIQNCTQPNLFMTNLLDYQGYEFALMSGLATGASITLPVFPFDLENPKYAEYVAFYQKWLAFGKKNLDILKRCVSFGTPIIGKIDGYGRFCGDCGFVFLCNSAPFACPVTFTLGEEIGFSGEGNYRLKQLYPQESYFYDEEHDRGIFRQGDVVSVWVPGYTVLLLQVEACTKETPWLYGVSGSYVLRDGGLRISDCVLPEGTYAKIRFQTEKTISSLVVNGKNLPFERENGCVISSIRFGVSLCRGIKKADGTPLLLEDADARDHTQVKTAFFLSSKVQTLLQRYGTFDSVRREAEKSGDGSNMFYAWAQPDRLWLLLPFGEEEVPIQSIVVNGHPVKLQFQSSFAITCHKKSCVFADITDYVRFDQDNSLQILADRPFGRNVLGAYLVYPKGKDTNDVSAAAKPATVQVPVEETGPYTHGGIQIQKAWLDKPEFEAYGVITLRVKVNCLPQQVKRILCSCPITIDGFSQLTMNTDRCLQYDAQEDVWKVKFIISSRNMLIIDDPVIHIQALDMAGNADTKIIPIEWKFPRPKEVTQ